MPTYTTGATGGVAPGVCGAGTVVSGAMGAGDTGAGGDQNNWLQIEGREIFTPLGFVSSQPDKTSPKANTTTAGFVVFMPGK